VKKVIIAFIAIIYMLVNVGFTVNVHYCMGEVDHISINESVSEHCGKCGMHTAESEGCCKDDFKLVKLTEDQKVKPLSFYDFAAKTFSEAKELPNYSIAAILQPVIEPKTPHFYTDTSPPKAYNLLAFYCTFLI
jgi:hypothetical protein